MTVGTCLPRQAVLSSDLISSIRIQLCAAYSHIICASMDNITPDMRIVECHWVWHEGYDIRQIFCRGKDFEAFPYS